ncbi:hypothetical protein DIPPA_09580 [Diplonema papillatum]|nr:hypothetical protein DIPPA_09580 [Diplonema papillatum]
MAVLATEMGAGSPRLWGSPTLSASEAGSPRGYRPSPSAAAAVAAAVQAVDDAGVAHAAVQCFGGARYAASPPPGAANDAAGPGWDDCDMSPRAFTASPSAAAAVAAAETAASQAASARATATVANALAAAALANAQLHDLLQPC